MTWTVNLNGYDDLSGDKKIAFEEGLVEKVKALAEELKETEGCNVTSGWVSTNTTGTVDLM